MKIFKILCILSGILFVYLAIQCVFYSTAFVQDLGLHSSETVTILARRTAMFMLGLAILSFGALFKTTPEIMKLTSITLGICLLGLAWMSGLEFFRHTVNDSILVALSTEMVLGTFFIIVFFKTPNHLKS